MNDYLRQVGSVRLRFAWEGGPYIEVHEVGRSAAEVIHVWDHAAGKPRIDLTNAAMREECNRWVDTYGDQGTALACQAALEHDVMTHWRQATRPNTRGGRVGVRRGPNRGGLRR